MSDCPKAGQPVPHSRDALAHNLLTDAAQILDVAKREWGPSWSDWDQGVRDRITAWLIDYHETFDGPYRYAKTSDGVETQLPHPIDRVTLEALRASLPEHPQ